MLPNAVDVSAGKILSSRATTVRRRWKCAVWRRTNCSRANHDERYGAPVAPEVLALFNTLHEEALPDVLKLALRGFTCFRMPDGNRLLGDGRLRHHRPHRLRQDDDHGRHLLRAVREGPARHRRPGRLVAKDAPTGCSSRSSSEAAGGRYRAVRSTAVSPKWRARGEGAIRAPRRRRRLGAARGPRAGMNRRHRPDVVGLDFRAFPAAACCCRRASSRRCSPATPPTRRRKVLEDLLDINDLRRRSCAGPNRPQVELETEARNARQVCWLSDVR